MRPSAAGVAQDSVGNKNTASSTASGAYDATRPTVTIAGVPAATNAAFTATFTFSEEVTGFVSGDITVTNAAVSGFSSSGAIYTAIITPTGDYTVSVAADVAEDSASNGNTASSTESGTYDATGPTVTITGVPAATDDAFTATFTFSKPVTGFVSGDITATNATVSGFSGSGATYTATITPTDDYTVSVAAGVAEDSPGNKNTASSTASGTWDTTGGVGDGPSVPAMPRLDRLNAALHLGADARLGSGLVGLALSVSEASFDYADGDEPVTGEYTARMTGLRPYWGRSWADGSRLWVTAGLSSGEVEIEDAEAGRQAADSGMASLAAGGALRLLPAADRGAPSLELEGEALAARLEVEGNGGPMEAVDAGVSRLRVALASEIEIEAAPGMPLVPSAELGLVWDGGDGETGAGLELGWGLSWAAPSQGLTLDARARTLLGRGGARSDGADGSSGRKATLRLKMSW